MGHKYKPKKSSYSGFWKSLVLLNVLSCVCFLSAQAQSTQVSGVVTASGEPLAGATIRIQGTNTGTVTDAKGAFVINADMGDILQVSMLGYNRKDVTINSDHLSITLQPNAQNLNEVIVVGYGTQTKKTVTGATVHVSGDELMQNHSVSTLQDLQGKAPGVQITTVSGQPGDALKIRIRGISTNGNSNPLYVVDGVPTDDISYLNPSDIQSVDILKDAASAAIYGTRAANGVILITTRQGKTGKLQLSLHAYYGWQNPTNRMDLLSAHDYAIIMNEAALNSGKTPYYFYSPAQIDSMGAGTNWQKEATNANAPIQNYDISFSGGNEHSVYASSLFYQKQEGIIGLPGNSYYERIGFRINSDHKVYKDIIKLGENLVYTHSNQSGIGTGNIYGNSIRGLLNTSPTFPVKNPDGSWGTSAMSPEELNPIAAMNTLNSNKTIYDKLFGNVYIEAQIIDGLKFRSSFGVDLSYNSTNSFIPVYDLATNSSNTASEADQGLYRNFTWTWDNTITYQQTFGDHSFDFLLGASAQEYNGFNVSGSKQDLIIPDFEHAIIDNGKTGTQKAFGSRSEYALNSYFGRINYSYKDKYLLTAIVRRDGSTNFGSNNRWATFPSFSAGWIVTNEDFARSNWLNFLKIRGGWGQNGNDRIQSFAYLATVSSQYMGYYFGGINAAEISVGTSPDKTPNPNLKWEASQQTDIGIDATLFHHFMVSFDWYNKTTKDWLVQPPIPDIVGTGAPYINGGDIVNRGVEIALNYNRSFNELTLSVGGNIAFNHNEARSVPNADGIIHGSNNVLSSSTEEFYRIQTGYPVGYFWGYKTNGIFQNEKEIQNYTGKNGPIQPNAVPGDVRFVDLNGDGNIDAQDKTMIGDPNPEFTYGINITAKYKAFDIAVTMTGVSGNDIVNGTRATDRFYNNYSTTILNRWHGEGTSNRIPRVTLGSEANRNYANFSDLYIEDGSYMRVKSVNIGYDFKKALFKDLPFEQCRLYLSGTNLLTFTHYTGIDPEVGYGNTEANGNTWSSGIDLGYYPLPRTILVGLDIKF